MASRDFERPDPEELLRRLELQEADSHRGRLKIFLGYAPRVGKSQRMFDEGLRRKSRGQDVVAGVIQEKGAAELKDYIGKVEIIPLKTVPGGEVLDTDAILKRHPEVVMVDALASDNPPGFSPEHRWEQVEELLEHGINVLTALNLQHVREQQDAVERITGKRAAVSVPEAFIRSADEIVIVDVPSEELAARHTDPGKRGAEDARRFAELRELALLLSADVVERQLQLYLDAHNIHQSWGTQERILICITPRSNAKMMIESGRRNAERSHGQLFALSVRNGELNREAQELLDSNLEVARRGGAEVMQVENEDPVQAIIDFARIQRITQIFIGHTRQRRWLPWTRTPVDRLIDAAEGMDVRIFPN